MNLDALLTAAQAAKAAGVSRQLFNYWRFKGKLKPNSDGQYRLRDVLEVERDMRNDVKSHRAKRPIAV